jgi:hypothetical protein
LDLYATNFFNYRLAYKLFFTPIVFSVLLLGFFTFSLSFAQSDSQLEQEKIQLENERRSYDQNYQNLQQQIISLTSTIIQLKNSNISTDKLQEIEEQLAELEEDLDDLQKSEMNLIEREGIFAKHLVPAQNPSSITEDSYTIMPDWFKNNAKWWKEDLISDSDIINALESLIIQDVIPLDNFVTTPSRIENTSGVQKDRDFSIPTYQKDVFGFWSEGLVSDSEIINSIGYLMIQGIINSEKIQTEVSERQAKFDKKMEELDFALEFTPDKIIDTFKNYRGDTVTSTTTVNSDGSKIISWSDGKTTTFYKDGSIITTYLPGDTTMGVDQYERSSSTYLVNRITSAEGIRWDNWSDGSSDVLFPEGYADIKDLTDIAQLALGLRIHVAGQDEISKKEKSIEGEMVQLIPIISLTIEGVQYPISQFTSWKWTGECDDVWHFHTSSTHAISIDGQTDIPDPDQENCGFGKIAESQITTAFMSQDQIDKFRELTGIDPLENEAMTGGSDTEENSVDEGSGLTSLEEEDHNSWTPYNGPDLSTGGKSNSAVTGDEFDDADGDGIEDGADPEPEIKNNEFGGEKSENKALLGKIIDRGDLTVTISHSAEGTVLIEVGTDGNSGSVIIEIMGVELELESGTILEAQFG